MHALGTWRAIQNKILRAPQLTSCIPAKNLHLKACAYDSLPSAQPWAFKLGFGKSTNGGPASRLWPTRTPAPHSRGGPPDLIRDAVSGPIQSHRIRIYILERFHQYFSGIQHEKHLCKVHNANNRNKQTKSPTLSVLSCFSHVWLFATLWTTAHQVPLSVGLFRQEHWSGLPCPPPGDLPNPGVKPTSLLSPALAGGFFTTGATWEAPSSWSLFYLEEINSKW